MKVVSKYGSGKDNSFFAGFIAVPEGHFVGRKTSGVPMEHDYSLIYI